MNKTSVATETAPHAAPAMTPAKGLLVLGVLVVVIAAFIVLNHLLGIADYWVAFLFLLYWGAIEHMKFESLPHCIVGAVVGLVFAYALQALPVALGAAGHAVFMVAVLVLIYCQLMRWFAVAINASTMLFLAVGTIPLIQTQSDFGDLFTALGVGIAFFAGLAWLIGFVQHRVAGKARLEPSA